MNVPPGLAVATAAKSYDETLKSARSVLAGAGQTIFAEIDQAAAATSSGLELRPTTVFVFGNPKVGTPLMQSSPLVALSLPLKLLVWRDDDGSTKLAYWTMSALHEAYAIDGDIEPFSKIDTALAALVEKIAES